MKVSLAWLQKYFAEPLPPLAEVVDTLTFHSSEVDEVIGEGEHAVLDVKVLPDRAPYALSHRGLAYELAAALDREVANDPFAQPLPEFPKAESLSLPIATDKCVRHMGAIVRGVTVAPSPAWLKEALESVGQRSINNIVDATNYVMLSMGQPLHAFDIAKISTDTSLTVGVRRTLEGESIQVLTGETYNLPEDTIVLCKGVDGEALDIAGVKGGMASAITADTTDILLSAANFDAVTIRRTSQALKLWTDASQRFQNKISPELVAYGMRDLIALVTEIAGGTLEGVVDTYPSPEPAQEAVVVEIARINAILGTTYSTEEITSALDRLNLKYTVEKEMLSIVPPFMRRDIVTVQDVAEEVGRVLGYDRVPPTELPPIAGEVDQKMFRGIEHIKDVLVERGFVEISTQSFATSGDILLANPLDVARPYLRTSLAENMRVAVVHAKNIAPKVFGPDESLRLFELGNVFEKDSEHLTLALGYVQLRGKQNKTLLADIVDALNSETGILMNVTISEDSLVEISLKSVEFSAEQAPARVALGPYKSFSLYPFALRDVAVWTPEGTEYTEVQNCITEEAGELLARIDLFDQFEKDGRTSFAFRLVFEASDRTLSDQDLNPIMEKVYARFTENEGWEVR